MQVKELRDGMKRVDIEGMITAVGETREVTLKTGGQARVADFVFDDGSTEKGIKLTLWDDQIDGIEEGDKLRITNGYVRSFMGELYLTVGKYGKLEKINSA
jgi:ssDNA-binding replication factor A large subunit